jgi:formate dehydrogenase assembly factor FdhD
MKARTHEQYLDEIFDLHGKQIEPVGKYVSANIAIKHRCICGNQWKAAPNNILHGSGCPTCSKIKMSRQSDHKTYCRKLKIVHGNKIKPIGTYVQARVKIEHMCSQGHRWLVMPMCLLQGIGCPRCSNKHRPSHEEFCEQVRKVHGDKINPIGVYSSAHSKIKFRCDKGHTFEASPSRVKLGSGCPYCNSSHNFRVSITKIRNQEISGQGFDLETIKYLIYRRKWKHPCKKEDKPTIRYRFKRGAPIRRYVPDAYFAHNNTLVEAKGLWTMGLFGSVGKQTNALGELKAKRRGCLQAGYKFELVLGMRDKEGEWHRISLPKNWYTLTKRQLLSKLDKLLT